MSPTREAETARTVDCASAGRGTPTERAGSRAESTTTPLAGVPVLVVDDDAPSAKLLSVILRAEGCKVEIAPSAEDAVALLRTFRPRLIVVDLILPLMSGLLFTQRLKSDAATKDIACIAVTAFNGKETERIVLEAGCLAYVRKPIDPMSFAQLVSEHLGDAT